MSAVEEIVLDEKIKKEIAEPPRYKVIFINDDVTPVDWVISLLIQLFKHSRQRAEELTMLVHHEGSAVVGQYNYEIAEQKVIDAISLSRDNGFPLKVDLEEDL